MNHHERRQAERAAHRQLASLSSRVPVTVHCRIRNQHIPLGEALALHEPGSGHCFSCGRGGNECQNLAKHASDRR